MAGRLIAVLTMMALWVSASAADPLRIASFNTELSRTGPGLLLQDLARGDDPQLIAVLAVITKIDPDIIALQGIDWDHEQRALSLLVAALAERGSDYPYSLSLQPNTGLQTGLDMDGDGRIGEPEDSQSFGRFTGANGMALLSKRSIGPVVDHSDSRWKERPDKLWPRHADGRIFPSEDAFAAQRLPYTGLWQVMVEHGPSLILFQVGPPVFDGPEDRNGLRNAAELNLIADMTGQIAENGPFVLLGGSNLDPKDGEGRHDALERLLALDSLQDPKPTSMGAELAEDEGHLTPNALDTVDWPEVGRLRVDYVLPDAQSIVTQAGVYWPAPGAEGHDIALAASRHRLVWVDLILP